jgi:hypothetical protein
MKVNFFYENIGEYYIGLESGSLKIFEMYKTDAGI